MRDALAHRGPDDVGLWIDPSAGIALAHRRLSILDLSPLGHQPMRSASGRHTLVLNGEIYNYRELRSELSTLGHVFHGTSDTEVLLAAITEHGFEEALARIRGMFAIGAWDAEERALYLARDRLGEKPLYYGWIQPGRTVVFGSELKALRAHPSFAARVDRGALMRFIRHGYVPAPHSIFDGINKLPAGGWLRIQRADDVARPAHIYYSLRGVAETGLRSPLQVDDREAADLLEQELRRAVREQMASDVPLGAFLSGGVDSSTIVALMQTQSGRPVKTFSIGFEERAFDESGWARKIAAHLGTEHTNMIVTAREALGVIPILPRVYDEPFADSSGVPTTLVARLARRHVTVALTGDGGDELFGGYPRYTTMRRIEHAFMVPGRRSIGRSLRRIIDWLSRGGTAATLDRLVLDWSRRRADVAAVRDMDEFYELYMSLWYHPEWVMHGVTEPRGVMPLPKDVLPTGNVTERAMLADGLQNLPECLLVKVDRAAMAVSLEARIPLLDPGVVALAWRLPFSAKVRGTSTKIVLRNVLARHVPRELFERPKMGFMIPVVEWLRGPLRDWAEALLDEGRLRREGFLDAAMIRRRWNAFQAGIRDWHGPLWTALMWQAWLEAS